MQQHILPGQSRKGALQLFVWAAVLALCALSPAIFRYGGRMVTRGDFMEQQIPFILETRRMLFSGTPFWDWNTFMGSNFFGSYAFYTLGSPFVWLLMPLPEAAIPYGISAMAVLKHAVAAVTAFLYLRRFVKDARYAQIGGLLYAFSSFSIINTQFYHFWDVVAVFPLLLLALENAFVGRRRYGALALACALNVMVNYYFFLGSAILVAVYTVFRFFSKDWREKRGFWQLFSVVFECGLGCLLAAWLLFPATWAMMGISRTSAMTVGNSLGWYSWANTLERLRALWMPIESGLVHAFYGDSASWSSVAGFLPMFGCALVLWHYLARPKGWLHVLLPVLVFCSICPPINRLFVLGSNSQYLRWWYGLVLLLCIPTVQALEALSERVPRDLRRLRVALYLTFAVSLCFTVPTMLPDSWLAGWVTSGIAGLSQIGQALLHNKEHPAYATDAFRVLACGLAVLNLAGLWVSTRKRFLGNRRVLMAALSLAIVANYAGFIIINDALVPAGQGVGYPTGVDYYAQHILLEDKPTFGGTTYTHRIDAPPKVRNYGMQINQPSITSFHSMRSNYLEEFVYMAGFGHSESPDAVPPDTQNGALRTLLGVKTYYNYDEAHYPGAPEGFVYVGREGAVSVYENQHVLPIGFAYDAYTTVGHAPLAAADLPGVMLQAVVFNGREDQSLYEVLTPLWEMEDQPATWQEAAAQRASAACYDVMMTPKGLTAKIDLEQEKLVFFSVQYDAGWSATINGEPAKLYGINLGFIGMRVPAGQGQEIVLSYRVRGLGLGIGVSAASVILLCGYVWWMGRKRRGEQEPVRSKNMDTRC